MKRLAILLLIGLWSLALAQAPDEQAAAPVTEPATDTSVPEAHSDDFDPDDLAVDEFEAEGVDTDPEFEASVEEVFKPGDEISEDFPIPLPADI